MTGFTNTVMNQQAIRHGIC